MTCCHILYVTFVIIRLHAPDGREIDVNAQEITSLQCKLPGAPGRLFAEGVNAVINLSDGKHVSARESCAEVRELISQTRGNTQ